MIASLRARLRGDAMLAGLAMQDLLAGHDSDEATCAGAELYAAALHVVAWVKSHEKK